MNARWWRAPALAAALFALASWGQNTEKPFDQPNLGMEPVPEHPGHAPRIPEPEKHEATSVGRGHPAASNAPPPSARRTVGAVIGTLKARSGDRVRIQDETGKEVELKLSPQAQASRDGKPVKLDEVRPGSEVRAAYSVQDGQKAVEHLEVVQRPTGHRQAGQQNGTR